MEQENLTGWDMFNMDVPADRFPRRGVPARAAKAIVNSEAWTDANPAMNLSSFVTTFMEPESEELARAHILKNYIDHDMYPQLFAMERRMVRWLHQLWNGPGGVTPASPARRSTKHCAGACRTPGGSRAPRPRCGCTASARPISTVP